jgi:hypothetical protein
MIPSHARALRTLKRNAGQHRPIDVIRLAGLLLVVAAFVLVGCGTTAPSGPTTPSPTPLPAPATVGPQAPASDVPVVPPEPDPSATSAIAMPPPACGGAQVSIQDALPCEAVAGLALGAVAKSAPALLATGVAGIDVYLEACPEDEVPPEIDCRGEPYAQFVTITFGSPGRGEASESGLTVVVAPVSGRVLGISDQLVL